MSKRLLLLVALACLPSYCYSESITPYFGTTGNAAADQAMRWSMGNVLPEPPGVNVNGVFYSYTPEKVTEDDFKVTIGNEKVGGGTIWSDTEDWSGNPGGIEVRKVIGLPNVPKELWGDGYIETEGTGTVEDATVIYSYQVNPCYDPQFDPNCPGYVAPKPPVIEVTIEIYDATQDENVNLNSDENKEEVYEEEKVAENDKEDEDKEKEKKEMRLEAALSAVDNSELFAQSLAQAQILAQINAVVNMTSYTTANIPGGIYKEDVKLIDTKIDDNKQGLRNGLAQQILHEEMVSMQYNN